MDYILPISMLLIGLAVLWVIADRTTKGFGSTRLARSVSRIDAFPLLSFEGNNKYVKNNSNHDDRSPPVYKLMIQKYTTNKNTTLSSDELPNKEESVLFRTIAV